MNKYCGEYLTIGNEIWPEEEHNDVSDEHLTEPVAEARVHLESNFHQFTNLKIIKAEPNNDSHAAASPRGRNNAELKMLKVLDKEKHRNKVYSQVICSKTSCRRSAVLLRNKSHLYVLTYTEKFFTARSTKTRRIIFFKLVLNLKTVFEVMFQRQQDAPEKQIIFHSHFA